MSPNLSFTKTSLQVKSRQRRTEDLLPPLFLASKKCAWEQNKLTKRLLFFEHSACSFCCLGSLSRNQTKDISSVGWPGSWELSSFLNSHHLQRNTFRCGSGRKRDFFFCWFVLGFFLILLHYAYQHTVISTHNLFIVLWERPPKIKQFLCNLPCMFMSLWIRT